MANQIGFVLPLGPVKLPVTVADILLGLAFLGVAADLVRRKLRGIKLPPVQAFVLVAVACVALARTQDRTDGAKEVLQLVEYFLVAFAVFVNVAATGDLRPFVVAFAAATGIAVLWGGYHYLTCASPFDVSAGYENRNLLCAFFAIALPLLYGIALHARFWRHRLVLLAIVAAGLVISLSGGLLLATLVILALLSAIRGGRALAIQQGHDVLLGLARLFRLLAVEQPDQPRDVAHPGRGRGLGALRLAPRLRRGRGGRNQGNGKSRRQAGGGPVTGKPAHVSPRY